MPVKQIQVKNIVRNFYNRGIARWQWLLAVMLTVIGLAIILPPALAALTPGGTVAVDDKINVSFSGLRLNRSTNTFDSLAKLTNQSTVPIDIPVQLTITSISSSTVTLANATGVQSNGAPYVNVPVSDGVLDPGEVVSNILLKFNNPQKTAFTFKHSVFGVLPEANHPPKANAGHDQSVPVGTEVTLSGINSTDEDGDSLTYRWRIVSQPANSTSQLDNPTAIAPKLLIDRKGSYQIELIINDGKVDSQPALVVITTENSKPVAMAGDDQTVFVQQIAHLDGINSKDIDGDTVTFKWTLVAKPTGSQITLQNETTQTPSLTPDKVGDYTVELIVNDGLLNSDPDHVIISTKNSIPIADAGPDLVGIVGKPVTLDGQLSKDADDDPLSFVWSVLNKPANSNPVLQNGNQSIATLIPDLPGDYISQLIVNDGKTNSESDTALITVTAAPPENHPPEITTSPVLNATVGDSYSYDVDANDSDNDTLAYSLSVFPTGMSINAQTGLISWTPAAGQTGPQAVTVNVIDGKGGSDDQSFNVTVAAAGQITVPDVRDLSRAAAETAIQQARLNLGTLSFEHNAKADGIVISQSPAANSSVAEGATVNLTISLGTDQGLPPNPETVAPAVDPTVATTLYASTQFLYSGSNPIQTLSNGQPLTHGTIEAKRAAVIRGKVMSKDNQPLPGVTITILNHPEYGQTLSRADGWFDLAVNGGGYLTANYQKTGFFQAQRQLNISWQDYVVGPDVILINQDSRVTTVDLTSNQPMQVARGTISSDQDGNRQATILFPRGTKAEMVMPDGSRQPLTTLSVRATEFTIGAEGAKSMPAELPPNVAYTYAVVFTADEAKASGAKDVVFEQPIPFYVENFLNFPVGIRVPLGVYDAGKGQWIPHDSGRVIKILSIENGLAILDTDGDGQGDDSSTLAALNITEAERQQLSSLYQAGQTLWRNLIPHFDRPWDCNWPFGPPEDDWAPPDGSADNDNAGDGSDGDEGRGNGDGDEGGPGENDHCEAEGSVIDCERQSLGESIDLVGTPFSLNYRSTVTPAWKPDRTINIKLSGASLPGRIKRIDLRISIAGRQFTQSYPAQPNQETQFVWDGKDSYGRFLFGSVKASVLIGNVYDNAVYMDTDRFGSKGNSFFSSNKARQEVTIWREVTVSLYSST